jgi:hypothetical protein
MALLNLRCPPVMAAAHRMIREAFAVSVEVPALPPRRAGSLPAWPEAGLDVRQTVGGKID